MKRVLYVIKRTDMSGAPLHLLQLMRHNKNRYDVHLCAGEEGFLVTEAARLHIPVHLVPSMGQNAGAIQFIRMTIDLRRLVRVLKPDLVHVHSPLAGVACRLACALEAVRCIFTTHGWNFAPGIPPRRRLASFVLEWLVGKIGQRVIAVSRYNRNLAVRFGVLNGDQVRVVYNGLPPGGRRAAHPEDRRYPVVIMVARFEHGKRQADLVNALADIQDNWRLCFVGDGPTRPMIKRLVAERNLTGKVEFMGTRQDVPELLGQADIFVLATSFEGLPLSILEAMRAELPVVASHVGGIAECVHHDQTGYLIRKHSVAELRRHLTLLLESPERRKAMGKAGRRLFEELFLESHMLENTALLYEEVLASGVPRISAGP